MNETALQKIVRDCLAESYGIEGSRLLRLPGENLNFLVTCAQDRRYVFKIVDDDMPPQVVEMENAAIEHAVSKGFKVRLPQIIRNKLHKTETRIKLHKNGRYRSRLIGFIDGKTLSGLTDISKELLIDVGNSLARFHRVMEDFDHSAARRDHRWNLVTAGQHAEKVRLFSDPGQRALLEWGLAGWRSAMARVDEVPWQFIHGDPHDENWLVNNGRVRGIVDFGDCGHNPVVCDLAICLAYLLMRGPDPLALAAAILDGYEEVRPLIGDEFELIHPLVCARLAVSLCVSEERKAIDADHPDWFEGEEATWALLRRLRRLGVTRFGQELR